MNHVKWLVLDVDGVPPSLSDTDMLNQN